MSVQKWQAWMALLPCDRCGWMPDGGCTCRFGVAASPAPALPRRKQGPLLPVMTLDERRAAYASLDVTFSTAVLEAVAANAADETHGRGAA